VIPQLSYYGKRFFIDNLDFGFTLGEFGANTLSLIATPGYDRVYFFRTDLQNFFVGFPNAAGVAVAVTATTPGATKVPPPAPHITYLAGPEWTFTSGQVSGQLDLLHDATGQNSGDEVRGAVGVPLQSQRTAQGTDPGMGKGTLTANVGFTWKSAATVNYYYRVPILYTGRAAFDPFVRLGYTLPLSDKWRFNAFAEYERLGKGIADSPIVADHSVATVFVGAVHAF
jgi:outer membrane protein